MEKSILQSLNEENGNYILPFLWLHGDESEETLITEIEKIKNAGIGALCVEARPHSDFCGEKWWKDISLVINEAKRRQMKVWILDDAHFPTGYANGIIAKKYPERSKRYFKIITADAAGPMPNMFFDTSEFLNLPADENPTKQFMGSELLKPENIFDDEIFGIYAAKMERSGKLGAIIDLQKFAEDNILTWDVPSGLWKIFVIVITRQGDGRDGYVNWIDPLSASCQIEAVYEPHWEHFKEEFGKTIAGFFSDEAEIGNTIGYNFDENIGKKKMLLPYSKDLCKIMQEKGGNDWGNILPALWYSLCDGEKEAMARKSYMDAVTLLIQENYSNRLGKWCENHGVEYIGHVIEDNNQHSRLGCGMGHYFRSLNGQHMAGIDDIGNQVVFGGENGDRDGGAGGDGEFYHYALGKLGASHAHIDEKKKGRTMCEIFGAYGWEEGTRLMKFLADHFMVRGVNVFVPHAFSPKEFPDSDCPPHFYAHGNNPLYKPFGILMKYMNRVCNVISNGTHCCNAAILYHGESQWMGKAMYMQKPARELLENQIDFDFLPSDIWAENSEYKLSFGKGVLTVNNENYRALVIPESEYLPYNAAKFAAEAVEFNVYIINSLPRAVVGGSENENRELLKKLTACTIVPLENLAEVMKKDEMAEISLSQKFPMLRYYHYKKDNHIFCFNNESTSEIFSGEIILPAFGIPILYDAYENKIFKLPYKIQNKQCVVNLEIQPYEFFIISMENEVPENLSAIAKFENGKKEIVGEYKVSYKEARETTFTAEEAFNTLTNISKLHPNFSGTIRYETQFEIREVSLPSKIVLPQAYEFASVWLNGLLIGERIAPPYDFNCGSNLKVGTNTLVIEVANTLSHQIKSIPNAFFPVKVTEPSGLIGFPFIEY